MSDVIGDIINLLSSNNPDLDTLTNFLEALPISQLDQDRSDFLLATFLNNTNFQNRKAARLLVEYFDKERVKFNVMPQITTLFFNKYIENVDFILTLYPNRNHLDYLVDLINVPDDDFTLAAAPIIIEHFPNIPDRDFQTLYNLTEEEDYPNQKLRAYFLEKIPKASQAPHWIITLEAKPIITPLKEYSLPSTTTAVEAILGNMSKLQFDYNSLSDSRLELREILAAQYAIASAADKVTMLAQIIDVRNQDISDDEEMTRLFGPVNSGSSCSRYGGCRMLTCCEFEETEEDDIMATNSYLSDWFTGFCHNCKLKINNRRHAVRLPLPGGGWKYCYCSIECIKADIDPDNKLIAGSLPRLANYLETVGIYDS